jgi:uncharacterized protein YjbI with pentapeptide repeats
MRRTITVMVILFLVQNYFTCIEKVGVFAAETAMELLGYVLIPGQRIKLSHGLKLSNQIICRFEMPGSNITLKNIDFSSCVFEQTQELDDIYFYNCSFRGARLVDLVQLPAYGSNTDFTDARIYNVRSITLTRKQLESTASFKGKSLLEIHFSGSDLSGTDFTGFTLQNTYFKSTLLKDCIFTDAVIEGCDLGYKNHGITFEQLRSTKSYQDGNLIKIGLNLVWSEGIADFSGMNLTGCRFSCGSDNQGQLDLTDSVITNCTFSYFKGLTLENIKSTWNYKHNRMEGIKLPEEIQKALDAEGLQSKKYSPKWIGIIIGVSILILISVLLMCFFPKMLRK